VLQFFVLNNVTLVTVIELPVTVCPRHFKSAHCSGLVSADVNAVYRGF